jgi:hypothetical protein
MILDTHPIASNSLEILDSGGCQAISSDLNEFENGVFGPDFHWQHHAVRAWINTGCFFSAAVRESQDFGRSQLIASASIFVTHSLSRDALFLGKIVDHELEPWFRGARGSVPTLYASSMISGTSAQRHMLYGTLFREVTSYFDKVGIRARSAFAIASTLDGHRHLSKIGFQPVPGVHYKGKYDFFLVNLANAQNRFWQSLLSYGDANGFTGLEPFPPSLPECTVQGLALGTEP